MTAPAVLSSKMRVPAPVGLRRERLTTALCHGPAPTVLVAAAAGSGKTTLLSHAAESSTLPVAWYHVTVDDTTVDSFTRHLASALQLTACDDGASHGSLDGLLTCLDRAAEHRVVVVDDLHEIHGSPAERALERFVALRPSSLRVLIGTRRVPDFNVSRLRVTGALALVRDDDLRFRAWEVEQLFRDVFEEYLPPEAAAALSRKTGGWAAGLQMFHLTTSDQNAAQRGQAVERLDGRSRLLRSYLAQNVLDDMESPRRDFLTRTCALGLLTGELCDRLLARTGSVAELARLEEEGVFTSSDDDGNTYRYHQVLQSHLEYSLLERMGSEGTRAWYSRCARLLESGHPVEALRAYARAEDWASVGRLMHRAGPDLPASAFGDWERLVPDALHSHDPWFIRAQGRRYLRAGRLPAAVDALRRAESLFVEPEASDECRRERHLVAAWTAPADEGGHRGHGLGPSGLHWTEYVRQAVGYGRRDHDHSADDREPLGAGLAALLIGHVRVARDLLRAARTATSSPAQSGAAALGSAVVALATGDRPAAMEAARVLALRADVDEQPWIASMARELDLALQGPGAQAPISHEDARLAQRDLAGDRWGAALQQLAYGICNLEDGRGDALLLDAQARFGTLGAPVLGLWAAAFRALAQGRRGALDQATLTASVDAPARRMGVSGVRAVAAAARLLAARPAVDDLARDELGAFCNDTGIDPGVLLGRVSRSAEPATADSPVRLALLGGYRFDVDGRALDLDRVRPRARALLRRLSMSAGRDVHREVIVEALWPDATATAGTHRLQVAVSSLRGALERVGLPGTSVLRRVGEAYRLELPAGSPVDVHELEELLQRARTTPPPELTAQADLLGAALDLYVGDLLPEDGPAEWVVGDRERLRRLAAGAAGELARAASHLGDVDLALGSVRRSVELDRYDDRSWQLLAALHEQAGDLAAAAHAREEHNAIVHELSAAGSREPPPLASRQAGSATPPRHGGRARASVPPRTGPGSGRRRR